MVYLRGILAGERMRCGLVSDIHSNLTAFQTVLADMGKVDALWCMGDVVGYGPEPNECIDLLRKHNNVCIPGNHDWACVGKIDLGYFNNDARHAALWTADQLTPENRDYLENLPLTLELENVTLAHGSPRDPIWEYLLHVAGARASFAILRTDICFVGHTHIPMVFREQPSTGGIKIVVPEPDEVVEMTGRRIIANPGSVGQPRDGDPRAAYAIYDTDQHTLQFCRVPYRIEETQARMHEVGLPIGLITRLSYGR